MITAPIPSIRKHPLIMNPVRRTTPPTLGAEIAFFMVSRLKMPIFLPDSAASETAMVTTPIPPIWMRQRITTCPNMVQPVAVSTTTSPVTQTADVEVNSASINGVQPPAFDAKGSASRSVPSKMTAKKPRMMIWNDESFRWTLSIGTSFLLCGDSPRHSITAAATRLVRTLLYWTAWRKKVSPYFAITSDVVIPSTDA